MLREIATRGYPGSQRIVYRFLKTLKTQEMGVTAHVPHLRRYSSTVAVSIFMRRPDTLEEIEREHLAAFHLALLFGYVLTVRSGLSCDDAQRDGESLGT
jgi:hypothetical protein